VSARAALRVTDAIAQLRDQLDRIRDEVAQLQVELGIETSRPVPVEETTARIDATVTRLQGFVAQQLMVGDLILPDGDQIADYLARLTVSPFAVAAVVAPDALKGWLLEKATAALETLPEPVDGPTRTKRVAALETKLRSAEIREADLCWQALEAGIDLEWRGDISPELVLGLEETA
jgi:hypothetical protein